MPKNVEIKAKIHNPSDIHVLAKKLSGCDGTIINQEDTFFKIPTGRLKLRKLVGDSELIFYTRPDQNGPKLSTFKKARLENESIDDLKEVLSEALGENGQVIKKRTLYMVGQTRVHVDEVEGLGNFMELEVNLQDDQTAKEGAAIARDIMLKLNIEDKDLIDRAYVDLLYTKMGSQ